MGIFKPAWMSEKTEKALPAVEKLNDPAKLAEAAKKAPLPDVREVAEEKLIAIAKTDEDLEVRKTAIENIDAGKRDFIPDMIKGVLEDRFSDTSKKYFIEFVYHLTKNKELSQYDGKILKPHEDFENHNDSYDDYGDTSSHYDYSSHEDNPEISIHF